MAFARAFSKRIGRQDFQPEAPIRTASARKRIQLGDISLPMGLLSSSNTIAYDAPDIDGLRKRGFSASTDGSRTSSEQEPPSPTSTAPSLTDGSTVASSPVLEHNHLSAYFPGPNAKSAKTTESEMAAPVIPQRAPSHSKREHVRLARSRSLRNSSGNSPDSTPKPSQHAAFGHDERASAPGHPFGTELSQLSEVVEDYHTVTSCIEQEQDIAYMQINGLAQYKPSEYLSLVYPASPFEVDLPSEDDIGGWI